MTTYDVTLQRTGSPNQTIAVAENETILAAARRAGVRLPADCRKGTCTTCVGRVVSVERGADQSAEIDVANAVDYRRSPRGLDEADRADGYALLCIALPRTDCRIRVGPRVRSEVGDSPWK